MRIALDTRPLETGHRLRGIGTYGQGLIKALGELDHKNSYEFITQQSPSEASKLQFNPNLKCHDLLLRQTADPTHYHWVADQWLLPQVLRRSKVDIVHFLDQLAAPLWKSKPTIITVQDLIQLGTLEGKSWKNQIKFQPVRTADRLIAISEYVKTDIINYFQISPEKITVIYHGFDHEKFRPAKDKTEIAAFRNKILGSKNQRYLLWTGSFGAHEPRKNLEFLIEAFTEYVLSKKDNSLHLILTGAPGAGQDYLKERIAASVQSKIHFVGRVESLVPYYQAATALVFPSLQEGFGLPPLEAMASGCPVIASNATSIPEVVGKGGILLDPTDKPGWIEAINQLCANENYAASLSNLGLKQANKFSWDKCAKETLAIYETFQHKH